MTAQDEEIIKKATFTDVTYPSFKKYVCKKGELRLTPKHLSLNCEGKWTKTFRIMDIRLKAFDRVLEIRGIWYGTLLFRLIIDGSEEWLSTFEKVKFEHVKTEFQEIWKADGEKKSQIEWIKLFDINSEALKKIYNEIQREMTHFRRKNLRFNLDIQGFIGPYTNRKLKAYIIAHSYVAWYEWTKGLLTKMYKAKFGKGPRNDEELITFLNNYPSLGILDTEEWEIKANQMRNCVAHESFYYDYKHSEVVFIVNGKEKGIKLREIEWKFRFLSDTYIRLFNFIAEKVATGKISPFE
jgi:hypothetical protein